LWEWEQLPANNYGTETIDLAKEIDLGGDDDPWPTTTSTCCGSSICETWRSKLSVRPTGVFVDRSHQKPKKFQRPAAASRDTDSAGVNDRQGEYGDDYSQGVLSIRVLRQSFARQGSDGKHDVVRCTCWFADEGHREVI
jgi:hypothetical protein